MRYLRDPPSQRIRKHPRERGPGDAGDRRVQQNDRGHAIDPDERRKKRSRGRQTLRPAKSSSHRKRNLGHPPGLKRRKYQKRRKCTPRTNTRTTKKTRTRARSLSSSGLPSRRHESHCREGHVLHPTHHRGTTIAKIRRPRSGKDSNTSRGQLYYNSDRQRSKGRGKGKGKRWHRK